MTAEEAWEEVRTWMRRYDDAVALGDTIAARIAINEAAVWADVARALEKKENSDDAATTRDA